MPDSLILSRDELLRDHDYARLQAEAGYRLPGGFLCYRPSEDAPAVAMPPDDRPFTFASYNSIAKIGPARSAQKAGSEAHSQSCPSTPTTPR